MNEEIQIKIIELMDDGASTESSLELRDIVNSSEEAKRFYESILVSESAIKGFFDGDRAKNLRNKITIQYERAIMSGTIQVKSDFFKSLQKQLSIKNDRPARLELTINDKLSINKNGILFLDKELVSDITEYKFFIPLL